MPKKLNVDLEELAALAARGYSVTMCCDAIGISRSYAYTQKDIMDAMKRGANKARQDVVDHLMARSLSDQSATSSIFLAKQLKVFDNPFPTSSPKSPSDALQKISNIFVAVSRNELSEEKGNSLIGYLEKYVKAYEITELEQRVQELENATKS